MARLKGGMAIMEVSYEKKPRRIKLLAIKSSKLM